MAITLDQLQSRFQLPGLKFEAGQGGLIKAVIETQTANGEIYLHGAHVTSYTPAGDKDLLWVSKHSDFADGKAIRGGVPICFPWFGPKADDPDAPGHGLARTKCWDFASASPSADGGIMVTLQTVVETFSLIMQVTFGSQLTMSLKVTHSDAAEQPATFEEALHTYFAIESIKSVRVTGLESVGYIDKVDSANQKPASGTPITFSGECDRVYLDTTDTCQITEGPSGNPVVIEKQNSANTVVWNPWIDKAGRMADFGNEEWREMVCVETANVGAEAIELAPGQSHIMTAVIGR